MSKKFVVGGAIALIMIVILAGSAIGHDWNNMGENPQSIPYGPDENGDNPTDGLNYNLYEVYGPVLLVLGILMFGAIIGGVCISREEDDTDDSD